MKDLNDRLNELKVSKEEFIQVIKAKIEGGEEFTGTDLPSIIHEDGEIILDDWNDTGDKLPIDGKGIEATIERYMKGYAVDENDTLEVIVEEFGTD